MESLLPLFLFIIFIVALAFMIRHFVRYGFVSAGEFGEKMVAYILEKLDSKNYLVINDLMLKTAKGSIQIDHVVVSAYGIFVIETKCYQGHIYGSKDAEYWTQNIYGNKFQMYNPTRQNLSHVRALHNLLNHKFNDIAIEPVVVFAGSATLTDNLLDEQTIYSENLLNWIYHFTDIKISSPTLIYDHLQMHNVEKRQRVGHVAYVQQVQQEQEKKIANGICPRCGGELTYRKGRYGNFWGCSNYPRCRFTMNER